MGATEGLWKGASPARPEASTILCTLVAAAQVGGGSSVLNLLCAKDQANENRAQVRYLAGFPAGYEGIPSHVFPTVFSSLPLAPLSWDLSPTKTHDAWLRDVMKLRL